VVGFAIFYPKAIEKAIALESTTGNVDTDVTRPLAATVTTP
jgi:hypothetical protein